MSERGHAFLVVEDNEGLRRQLERVLARFGTVVAIATVGDAVKALAAREFDGLWIDVRLPDGSGVEVLSHARQNRQNKGYAALVSADLEPHLVNEAYRFEAQYLVKPFSLTDVHAFFTFGCDAQQWLARRASSGVGGALRADRDREADSPCCGAR